MPILDLFSKRQKRLRTEASDVLVYDSIPKQLRGQIIYIWRKAIGQTIFQHPGSLNAESIYTYVRDALREEYGVFELVEYSKNWAPNEELEEFLNRCSDNDRVLDQIELTFRVITRNCQTSAYQQFVRTELSPEEAVEQLNTRFREHGIGYQFEYEQLIRSDSMYLHAEVVKSALQLLHRPDYKGANLEFLKAHEHFRHGDTKAALNECLKTLESVLKIICHKRKWKFDKNDTAKRLIEICFEKGLVPDYLQSQFASLRSLIESGIPTLRNKTGGHGQGPVMVNVPLYLAHYALNMTASTVVFLCNAELA